MTAGRRMLGGLLDCVRCAHVASEHHGEGYECCACDCPELLVEGTVRDIRATMAAIGVPVNRGYFGKARMPAHESCPECGVRWGYHRGVSCAEAEQRERAVDHAD